MISYGAKAGTVEELAYTALTEDLKCRFNGLLFVMKKPYYKRFCGCVFCAEPYLPKLHNKSVMYDSNFRWNETKPIGTVTQRAVEIYWKIITGYCFYSHHS